MKRCSFVVVLGTLWGTLAGVGCLAAQVGQISSSLEGTEIDFGLEVESGKLEIALEDAIAMALRNNLGLRVERYQRAQSLFRIQQNLGIFDLTSDLLTVSFDEESPAAAVITGTRTEGQRLNLSLTQLQPFGGTITLDWLNRRDDTDLIFATVNPSYRIDFDLTVSQPLLRDFGRLATERNIRVARNNSDISIENLELAIIDLIGQVEAVYWTLVETREQMVVAQESLKLAQELHEMNQVQVEVGTLAPLELIQSQVGVATREEDIIIAQAAIDAAADELRRLLNVRGNEYWQADVIPSTDPVTERIQIDVDEAIEVAMEERPELSRQRIQLANLELDSSFFGNQKLPSLDVQVSYGFNGLGGDIIDPDDPSGIRMSGGYDDALEQITEQDFPGWSVALNFGYPIQNRTARAQKTIADLALEQGRTQLDDLELFVRTEVLSAWRDVNTAAKRIDSARVSRELAERNVEAEQKKYENGLSTSFEILIIQEDLAQARSREVNAITSYRRALLRYYTAIGRLLEEKGVELVDETDKKVWRGYARNG